MCRYAGKLVSRDTTDRLVMQCGVKRKRSQSTTEFDVEHQHTLFDLSMMKLHQEHMRNGMEPRFVRFVLINNALKLLQMHMLRLEEEDALGSMDYDGSSSHFFTNTFQHGLPRPLSPLASPTKTIKLDQNPLLVATPFQSGEECEEEEGPRTPATPPMLTSEERRVGLATVNSLVTVNQSSSTTNNHLTRHSSSSGEIEFQQSSTTSSPRRVCQETSSDTSGATSSPSSSSVPSPPILEHISLEPSPQLDVTPSQDFAKVDTAIYDYDIPSGSASSSSARTCTMQAIGTPVVQNGDSGVEDRDGSESPPDTTTESDFLDELDHIVNLLMT